MEIIYHRLFQRDINGAVKYYDGEGGTKLGDRFFAEVEAAVKKVIANPKHFHYIEDGFRRAPLDIFPYHLIFEESSVRLRFLILRHDRRHPSYGMRRR